MAGFRTSPGTFRDENQNTLVYSSESLNSRTPLNSQETKPRNEDDERRSSMSNGQEHEMDEVESLAGSEIDEESGLTTKERQRKRRRNHLDHRIADLDIDGKLTKEAAKLADKRVIKNILINAALIAAWYSFSLSISIYNKWMFSPKHLNFHYPLFTTALHMVVQFTLATLVLLAFPSLRPRSPPQPLHSPNPPKPLITLQFYITRLLPCGTTTSLDIGLGNTSLRFITLTFYTMCKSSVLIWVLLFAFVFRLETPSWKLIAIILTMTLGVLMMVFGETAFHALGFALAISASFFSGFRWALTQILLLRHPATSNPFITLFLLSPIMFATLFLIALFAEGPSSVVASLATLSHQHSPAYVTGLLLFPGVLAFCMIASEFTLLQRTNVVTLSICGIFKEVVTIAAAEIVFHDYMTLVNFAGLMVTIVSIASYNYLKITKMRQDARMGVLAKRDPLGMSHGVLRAKGEDQDEDAEGSGGSGMGSGSESGGLMAGRRGRGRRASSAGRGDVGD